jgi:hypothetical protein
MAFGMTTRVLSRSPEFERPNVASRGSVRQLARTHGPASPHAATRSLRLSAAPIADSRRGDDGVVRPARGDQLHERRIQASASSTPVLRARTRNRSRSGDLAIGSRGHEAGPGCTPRGEGRGSQARPGSRRPIGGRLRLAASRCIQRDACQPGCCRSGGLPVSGWCDRLS